MFDEQIIRLRLCWILLAIGSSRMMAQAGPHHWLVWRQGTIRHVDAQQKIFEIEERIGANRCAIRWDKCTKEWDGKREHVANGKPVVAETPRTGRRAQIQIKESRDGLLAKRIVVFEPSRTFDLPADETLDMPAQ